MSGRSWFKDTKSTSVGLVNLYFAFKTNGSSDPVLTDAATHGFGGLTGGDGSGTGVANSGPAAIASLTHSATGDLLMTLSDSYRFVQSGYVQIDDGADNYEARWGTIANEGLGNEGVTGVTAHIIVRDHGNSNNTVDTTGRIIRGCLILKDSAVGS